MAITFTGSGSLTSTPSNPPGPTVVGPGYVAPPVGQSVLYWPEKTIHYKTYLKETIRDAMVSVFSQHPDSLLAHLKVTLDTPRTEADFPAIILKYYENRVERTGLFNTEYNQFLINGTETPVMNQESFFYWGTIEWSVVATSSYDRDLISDSIVQTVMASELETWANSFRTRIYTIDGAVLDTQLHFINLNHGRLKGFGETNEPVSWNEEDEKFYRTSHRTEVFGQFLTPPDVPIRYIESYSMYPYLLNMEPLPTGDPRDYGAWTGKGPQAPEDYVFSSETPFGPVESNLGTP